MCRSAGQADTAAGGAAAGCGPVPGEGELGHGPCTFLSSSLDLTCTEDRRWWKTKGSPLAFEGWLMGAVPRAALSPLGSNPSSELQPRHRLRVAHKTTLVCSACRQH